MTVTVVGQEAGSDDIYDLVDSIDELVSTFIKRLVKVRPDKIGLDIRCGLVYVGEDVLVVAKSNDPNLQYYGGFEYVSKSCRKELGNYVAYLGEDDRVRRHLDRV